MPVITLPDGSCREFDRAVSVRDVAESIGAGLAKAALAGRVNGDLVDLSRVIDQDAHVAIVTAKDPEGVEVIRHSTAHLLAQAVKLLYPEAQVTIGPVVENGFYYDFSYQRPFTPEDLAAIEKKMEELVAAALPVQRQVLPRDEAAEYFQSIGEAYKAEIIRDIPVGQDISLYSQGDFTDLCRGPHVPDTAKLKAFKLTKIAGAYWRGDAKNEMLQRIYGTAWAEKKDLKDYLQRLEEAERRDHRKIGKALDLYHMQEEAPGMVFWHPKGWTLWQIVEQYMRGIFRTHGYEEIRTPLVVSRTLWEKSGHWDKFQADMFTTMSEQRDYAIKPMNCPCHVQVYNQGLRSYRELPLRLAEFGACHRNELSGVLHGLMRVRGFTQDDAHIFCTEDQIQAEVSVFIDLLHKVYADFGFEKVLVKLSTRPANRVGSDAVWDKAEAALEEALNSKGLEWQLQPGEGAFYGPKIEFSLSDCLDRVWQCGTIQVDFSMPERLGAVYVGEDGSKHTPVMLHRAILGSMERFIGILVEHYAGYFPLWLAPVQVAVLNITDSQAEYAREVVQSLEQQGLRAVADLRNEKIGFKIREHSMQRVPYLIILGEKELESRTVSLRTQKGEDLGLFSLPDLNRKLAEDARIRAAQH
ncbi:MAG TPA: threonine--tRNA ligase [Methylococcaceae bacterium]|nr:threonine--tRNA ligase [Methylococcaceae bacterium]